METPQTPKFKKVRKPKGSTGRTSKDTQFKPGNQFWKQRSKHGRDTLFASPELLLEAATEYFKWQDENPDKKAEWKSGKIVYLPVKRPYTLTGFCLYIEADEEYITNFKKSAACTPDFLRVIGYILKTIYDQKFVGAANGFFNANIIARDLGLRDASDITTKGKEISSGPQINLTSVTSEDLRQLLKGSNPQSDKG